MSLERLQCPSCGASVTTGGHDSFFCNYCGAKLKVKLGSSGDAMAELDAIKEDTGLLARRAAYEHLVEELQRRRVELRHINEAWNAELGDDANYSSVWDWLLRPHTVWRGILLGIVILLLPVRLAQRWAVLLIFYALIVGCAAWRRHRRFASAQEKYWASQTTCQREIFALQDKISTLKAEIDRLIGDL